MVPVVATMAVLAMTGRRNVVLLALVAPRFVAEVFRDRLSSQFWRRLPAAAAVAACFLAFAAWPLSGRYYLHMEIPARFGLGATPSFFPWGAPDALDRLGVSAQIWNSNSIGGFLMFETWPRRLPLTEGRWTAYDDATVERILGAAQDPVARRWVMERWKIGAFLLQHTSPEARTLLPVLAGDPGWRLAWYDSAASIWVPASHAGRAVDLSGGAAPPGTRLPDDALMLESFYAPIGAGQIRLANLDRALPFAVRRVELLRRKGELERQLGHFAAAERTWSGVLDSEPSDPAALGALAFLAYRRGDLVRAEALLVSALESTPDDGGLRENLERVRAAEKQRQRGAGVVSKP
jgi:hypothetical protein